MQCVQCAVGQSVYYVEEAQSTNKALDPEHFECSHGLSVISSGFPGHFPRNINHDLRIKIDLIIKKDVLTRKKERS